MKQYTLVKFDYSDMTDEWKKEYLKVFEPDKIYIYLGEITQMPGHCIVIEMETGKVISGYHTENFIELKEDEC